MSDYPGKYVVHCHMLDHEDHGLMSQFEVVGRLSQAAACSPCGASGTPIAARRRDSALRRTL